MDTFASARTVRQGFWLMLAVTIATRGGASIAAPANGDVLFLQDGSPTQQAGIFQVNPATGNLTAFSQPGVRGNGPGLYPIGGIAVGPQGDIYATGDRGGTVFRIDPTTGDRTVISSPAVGAGPTFEGEGDLIVAPTGDLFVTHETSIYRVNPTTGDRSLVSGPGKGTGQSFVHVLGLTRTPSGNFFAFETSASSPDDDLVFSVNGATGDRAIVSGGNIGSGPSFDHFAVDVQLLRDGSLAVSDQQHRILRVDPVTGARSVLAGPGVGSGPDLDSVSYLTLDSGGVLLASASSGIFQVDPTTGDRTLIAPNPLTGGGVPIYREAVEYVAVPEPSGLLLAGLGLAAALVSRRRVCTGRFVRTAR